MEAPGVDQLATNTDVRKQALASSLWATAIRIFSLLTLTPREGGGGNRSSMKTIAGVGSEAALSLVRSMYVRAAAVMVSIAAFASDASQALCTYCAIYQVVVLDWLHQDASTATLVASVHD